MKRIFLFLLLACCLTLLVSGAALAEQWKYESDFSSGTDGWYPRSGGGASLTVTAEGLQITGRSATWHSPGRAFDLTPGTAYTLHVEVLQEELDSGRFILSVEHASGGQTSYENLATAQVPKGTWTALDCVYTAGDYETFVLYVEGGEATTSFTIRGFTLTGEAPAPKETPAPVAVPESAEERSALLDRLPLAPSYKKAGNHNPLYTQRFGADPGYLVWDGRLYIYTTNDVIEYDAQGQVKENSYGKVNKINCISSSDLVNWTDHGAIPAAGSRSVAKWAGNSWAPCAAHKTIDGQEKFFLYFCNGGNGICVLTADSPIGPWSDPLGRPLVDRRVPGCAEIPWLFDPAVMVDEDGTGYLAFGGGVPTGKDADPGTVRVVQLGEDMVSLAGDPVRIDAPYVFEDSGLNRIGDKYVYSYCSNWNTQGNTLGLTSGAIQYMVADAPLGPYTYAGELFPNQGRFFGLYGNNHHSILSFQGQYYLAYHNRPVEQAMGITGNYRSPQLDVLEVSEGLKLRVKGTMAGPAQLAPLCPYEAVSCRTICREAGVETVGDGPEALLKADSADWLMVEGVSFDRGASAFTLRASAPAGGMVRVCLDGTDSPLCDISLSPAQELAEVTVDVADITGTHDVYLIFLGDVTADWWRFTAR